MIPVLDFREALVERLPDLSIESLRQISRKQPESRQKFLTQLLASSYERRRPHKLDHSADAFSRDFLKTGLPIHRYKDFLRLFYEFPEKGYGYSRDLSLTKPYKLRLLPAQALLRVYESDEPLAVDWEGAEQGATGPPTNGIPKDFWSELAVPALLPIPAENARHAISRVEGWFREYRSCKEMPLKKWKPNGRTWGDALRLLYAAKKHIVSLGGLPNIYTAQSTGRLGPHSGAFHLIRVPNVVRRLLYEGTGMQDYDIASCFWSIFHSLGKELGFQVDWVHKYLHVIPKQRWHARWAGITQRPELSGAFKGLALSWLTGGTLSSHGATRGAQLVGEAAMKILATDWVTRSFYDEVRQGMVRVVEECGQRIRDGGDTVLVNAVGARLRLRRGRRDFAAEAMHILVGYEQFAIREAARRVPGVQAIIYDGFIAPPTPVAPLEEAIRDRSAEQLGFKLHLKLKQEDISEPLPDPEVDASCF